MKWKPKKGDQKPKLVWNSTIAEIDGYALVFIWQDNNTVLIITTAHSLHKLDNKIVIHRRRPKATSTNAQIVWPVFEGFLWKELPIPIPIIQYNKTMHAIDNNNQLREGFTIYRPYEDKWWRSLLDWLLDLCFTNTFKVWKYYQEVDNGKLHDIFWKELEEELL